MICYTMLPTNSSVELVTVTVIVILESSGGVTCTAICMIYVVYFDTNHNVGRVNVERERERERDK